MALRKLFLRILLASLALSAAAGVLAALTQGGLVIVRVIGTALSTAVACGLLIGASLLAERERSRAAGLLGMLAVGSEYILMLLIIWEAPQALFGWAIEDEIGLSMAVLGPAAVLCMVGLTTRASGAAPFGLTILGAALTSASLFLLAIWLPVPWQYETKLAGSGGSILPYGLLVGLCLLSTRGLHAFGRGLGVLAAAIAWAMIVAGIWTGVESDLGTVLVTALTAVAAALAMANVLLLCALTPRQRWLRTGTIVAAFATASVITWLVVEDRYFDVPPGFHAAGRLTAAGSILTGCGALAIIVLALLNRRFVPRSPAAELGEIALTCPRCGLAQRLPPGRASCRRCGLGIHLTIEEPRCPCCDYRLYGQVRRCPECGTELGQEPAAGTPTQA